LEILYFDNLNSTHLFLVDAIKNSKVKAPIAVVANSQSGGVGSGKNSWISLDGNLFLSFGVKISDLSDDLPLNSASIYFAFILKEYLNELGSKVWIKWPNDFYISDKKVGGLITKFINDEVLICSIGLNIKSSPKEFAKLDIELDRDSLIDNYLSKLDKKISWKYIFSKFEIEFNRSKDYFYMDSKLKKRVSISGAILQEDGSIIVDNRKVYSLR